MVSAFIPGVSIADAIALNKLIDGDVNTGNKADSDGRCIYSAADGDNKTLFRFPGTATSSRWRSPTP